MKVTDDMVKAATNVAWEKHHSSISPESMKEFIEAAIQAATEVEQEPVGYVYTHRLKELNGTDKDCRFFKYEGNEISDYYTKLYTNPQPDQTALINQLTDELNKTEAERVRWMTMALTSKRNPLSDELLSTLWGRNPVIGHTRNEFIMLARVVEKAHGIGG
jgi:predicted NAD/FAD-dependent oxidoreductase